MKYLLRHVCGKVPLLRGSYSLRLNPRSSPNGRCFNDKIFLDNLRDRKRWSVLVCEDSLDSTMNVIDRMWESETIAGVVIAYEQSAGIGRKPESKWRSPAGSLSLTITDHIRLASVQKSLSVFQLMCALAVYDAIVYVVHASSSKIRLKWPNDVMLDGSKVAGILCKATCVTDEDDVGMCEIRFGVGINVFNEAATIIEQTIVRSVSSLSDYLKNEEGLPLKNGVFERLCAELLNHYDDWLRKFTSASIRLPHELITNAFTDRWTFSKDGGLVRIMDEGGGDVRIREGRVLGLDDHGRLRVSLYGGNETLLDDVELILSDTETTTTATSKEVGTLMRVRR